MARAHIVLDFQATFTSCSSPSISQRDLSARNTTLTNKLRSWRKGLITRNRQDRCKLKLEKNILTFLLDKSIWINFNLHAKSKDITIVYISNWPKNHIFLLFQIQFGLSLSRWSVLLCYYQVLFTFAEICLSICNSRIHLFVL